MSITAEYSRLSPAEFREMCDNPEQADRYFGFHLNWEDDENDELDRWLEAQEATGKHLDIVKTWHGLHFLLTGEANTQPDHVPLPLRNVVVGGMKTPWEASYGNVRYLTAQEVRDVALALSELNAVELRERYQVAAFQNTDIYPGGEVWSPTGIDEILEAFTKVRAFFSAAAEVGEMVLLEFA